MTTSNSGDVVVEGLNNTLIKFNGVSAASHTIAISQPFKMDRLTINLKGGGDRVELESVDAQVITAKLGAGSDEFSATDVVVRDSMRVTGGTGFDVAFVYNSPIPGSVTMQSLGYASPSPRV